MSLLNKYLKATTQYFQKSGDIKVKANNFVNTLSRVQSQEIEKIVQDSKRIAPPPPPPVRKAPVNVPVTAKQPAPSNELEGQFANMFNKNKEAADAKKEVSAIIEDYLNDIIQPTIKNIKDELEKHDRQVKAWINKPLLMGSVVVNFKGRIEYEYTVQVKAGANPISTKLSVRGSDIRGGFEERKGLSGAIVSQVTQKEIINDFLKGYKSYLSQKGWL